MAQADRPSRADRDQLTQFTCALCPQVTLAGGGARVTAAGGTTGTELDLRLRRNVFRLSRRSDLANNSSPDAINATALGAAAGVGGAGNSSGVLLPPAVLTLCDLTTVNMPQGAMGGCGWRGRRSGGRGRRGRRSGGSGGRGRRAGGAGGPEERREGPVACCVLWTLTVGRRTALWPTRPFS